MGYQALVVGTAGVLSSLDNALTARPEFGLKKDRAIALIRDVAQTVQGWAAHFMAHGVCASDMAQLHASLDRDELRLQRQAFC